MTLRDPGIAALSRSAPEGFATLSWLPHTISVGAFRLPASSSLTPPRPLPPASDSLSMVNADLRRSTRLLSII